MIVFTKFLCFNKKIFPFLSQFSSINNEDTPIYTAETAQGQVLHYFKHGSILVCMRILFQHTCMYAHVSVYLYVCACRLSILVSPIMAVYLYVCKYCFSILVCMRILFQHTCMYAHVSVYLYVCACRLSILVSPIMAVYLYVCKYCFSILVCMHMSQYTCMYVHVVSVYLCLQ